MMNKRTLKTVTRTQGNNRALKQGAVRLPDFTLDFEEVNPLPRAFRAMVREQAYDVSEMALTTYITARAYGVPITAIPVFLVRDFHHKSMVTSAKANLQHLKDLEGRRVGVSRGYTVTTGVWARAILAEEHGVDLSKITWARSDDEHVPNWRMPTNVQDLGGGKSSLEDQLARGDIDAAVGVVAGDATRSLIADPFAAGLAALKSRGFYPINHLVVVRDDILVEVPELAEQLFDAFSASKRAYLADLKAGRIAELTAADKTSLAVMDVMDDPLPYGIAPNADILNNLMDHVIAQGIIDARIPLEKLFAANTQELIG
jgi:4,5-dihydroxyphthalate decarboxylase